MIHQMTDLSVNEFDHKIVFNPRNENFSDGPGGRVTQVDESLAVVKCFGW